MGWPQGLLCHVLACELYSPYLQLSAPMIFVDQYLGWLLHWSSYLQFACSVELCGSLLCLRILPIQCPALLTPYRKWFVVGIGSGKFLHCSSISATVLFGGLLQGWFLLIRLPWNLPAVPGIFVPPPSTFDDTIFWAHQLGFIRSLDPGTTTCLLQVQHQPSLKWGLKYPYRVVKSSRLLTKIKVHLI